MSDQNTPAAPATIRAIRFFEKYVPNDKGELVGEDWVEYCAPGQAAFTTIEDAVKRVKRDKSGKWLSIEAAYRMWKSGEEIPEHGTPLGAWPGVNKTQIEVLKGSGLRTVEDVANMNETTIQRLKLPTPRLLKDQAARFLEAMPGLATEKAIQARDEEIAALKSQMEDLMALVGGDVEKRGPGRPRKEQAAA